MVDACLWPTPTPPPPTHTRPQRQDLEDVAHDKSLLSVDLAHCKAQIEVLQQECIFLASAVKEMVTNAGRISTRLEH